MNPENGMRPVHPGEILREELDMLGLSVDELSKELDVSANRVTMILNGHWDVSEDTALRLADYFGTTPQLWLNLQKNGILGGDRSKRALKLLNALYASRNDSVTGN